MMRAVRFLGCVTLIVGGLIATPSQAQTVTLPIPGQIKLAGIDVSFPIAATLTVSAANAPVALVAHADLADLTQKIDSIVRAAGLHDPAPGAYQSFNYNGTSLQVAGNRLWAKYHFRVDPRKAKPTNGSVELFFRPIIEANALRLVAENPTLNISRDVARGLVQRLTSTPD